MQFSKVALPALFAALASAGVVRRDGDATQDITVTDFYVRNIDDKISSSSLIISPAGQFSNITCSTTSGCSIAGWSYQVDALSTTEYTLTVYDQTSDHADLWGQQNVTLSCHAGGSGAGDFACDQPAFIEIAFTLHE